MDLSLERAGFRVVGISRGDAESARIHRLRPALHRRDQRRLGRQGVRRRYGRCRSCRRAALCRRESHGGRGRIVRRIHGRLAARPYEPVQGDGFARRRLRSAQHGGCDRRALVRAVGVQGNALGQSRNVREMVAQLFRQRFQNADAGDARRTGFSSAGGSGHAAFHGFADAESAFETRAVSRGGALDSEAAEQRAVVQPVPRMGRRVDKIAPALALCLCLAGCHGSAEAELRRRLASQTSGTIHLPTGVIEISAELQTAIGAHDLEIVGSGTILKATDEFKGRAVLVAEGVRNLRLRDFNVDGNRIVLEKPLDSAPPENALRQFYPNNGVLLDRIDGGEVSNLILANIANMAMIVSRSSKIRAHELRVEDCGSLDARGHSNSTGGVVLEEGTSDFEVRSSVFRRIRGNALWTHSNSGSPRLNNGIFSQNRFDAIGRNAILVWNAANIRVEENTGQRIGYPAETVDPVAQPAAIATLGNVDHSTYARNHFEEIDGKCI